MALEPVDAVRGLVQYIEISERLLGAAELSTFLVQQVGRIAKVDNELAPELLAAVEALGQAQEALTRAHTFVATRLEVAMSDE